MKDKLEEMILKAHRDSYRIAFEVAVRTGTALVYARGDKIVEIKPPYRYELVPIKPKRKKKPKSKRSKRS